MTTIKIKLNADYIRKDGTCAIFGMIHMNGQRVKLPLDQFVEPVFWDEEEQKVKETHPDHEDMNDLIEHGRNVIWEIRKRFILQDRTLTPELLRMEFAAKGSTPDFIAWMYKEIDAREGEIGKSTRVCHHSVLKKFKGFRHTVAFGDLSPDILNQFQAFCRTKHQNSLNTVSKAMRVLKTYINIAISRELITKNPFDNVKVRKGDPSIVYLSEAERTKIMEMFKGKYTYEKHSKVLHYFLFACYTGLRISDIKRLRWKDIVNGTIYFTPYKTRSIKPEVLVIPLGHTAKWLLDQCERSPRNPYIFEVTSEQNTNRVLKDVADMLGIRKNLHFHVARHTFATLFYERTNDLATLQKLLGHSSIVQTMVYAHVSEELRREQMELFDVTP
jgi:integrase/recombinase XerD